MTADSLHEFWHDGFQGSSQGETDESTIGGYTRRGFLGAAGALGIAATGTLGILFGSSGARADVATGNLDISGDSITTDNGQLTGLTVSLDGHVSYDGLDTVADTVEVTLYAALSGGDTSAAANVIGAQTFTVADVAGLGVYAGSTDVVFDAVDVLASDAIATNDFRSTTQGGSKDTAIDFRLEERVLDGPPGDTNTDTIVTSASSTSATVTVTNEVNSGNTGGNGAINGNGRNQSP